jgi:molybdate transport system substrate-binding protein
MACAALVILAAGCSGGDHATPAKTTLMVYCANTMRQPMEAIAQAYLEKTGVRVELSMGDSGTLLIQAEERKAGDGFVVHDPFAVMAEAKGLVTETRAMASMVPAIGVKIGTKGETEVKGLADLARPGLKIGIPDPEYSTAGHLLAAMLAKAGLTDGIMSKKDLLVSRTSGDLVNALALGSVDAIVAWDALLRRNRQLRIIPIADRYRVDAITSATGKTYGVRTVRATMSSLKSSKEAGAMKAFLDFAAGPSGRAEFEKLGFSPAE